MAHFAQLDENNKVIQVIVVSDKELLDEDGNEVEEKGIEFCKKLFGENTRWLQTSYNTYKGKHKFGGKPLRQNYAGIGYKYDEILDAFIPPESN